MANTEKKVTRKEMLEAIKEVVLAAALMMSRKHRLSSLIRKSPQLLRKLKRLEKELKRQRLLVMT